MSANAQDVIRLAREKVGKIVDLRFVDLPGMWHFSIPVADMTEALRRPARSSTFPARSTWCSTSWNGTTPSCASALYFDA